MFFYLRKVTLTAVLMVAALTSCTNNGSPTGPQQSAPSVPTVTLKGPSTNSTDPNAQMLKSTVSTMNSYTSLFSTLQNLHGAQSGDTWTWTFPEGTLSAKLVAVRQVDGSSRWTLTLNGADTSNGQTYTNWVSSQGSVSADGKSGSWQVFSPNTTTLAAEYDWSTTINVVTGTLNSYSSGVLDGQTIIINNPDNTGQMTTLSNSIIRFKAIWQANGSGHWWTYDPNGTQTATGAWT